MFIPFGTPLPSGPSLASVAADLGLTDRRPEPTSRPVVPAPRRPLRQQVSASTR